MNIDDFSFGGGTSAKSLSSMGYMVCSFSSDSGFDNRDGTSNMTLNYVSRARGREWILSNVAYADRISLEFSICKIPTNNSGEYLTPDDYYNVINWLVKEDPDWLAVEYSGRSGDSTMTLYYRGNFNFEVEEHRGRPVGFNLTFETESPFAYLGEQAETFTSTGSITLDTPANSNGIVFPDNITIVCGGDGNLTLTNRTTGDITIISDCTSGETITLDCKNKIITTDNDSHDIYDKFNYKFPSIKCGVSNTITTSMNCELIFIYRPKTPVIT